MPDTYKSVGTALSAINETTVYSGINPGTVSHLQRIEGYLAWKWELQANLPTNHPYKNVVPTI